MYELVHINHRMLVWEVDSAGKCHCHFHSIGIGSVTDQQIMNAVFEELKLPYRYKRDGGARIEAA